MNLLDLKVRPPRRQGVYWASIIVSIVAHGGFLVYVLAYARPPAQPQPPLARINVEVIGTAPSAALRRGDREDVTSHARLEDVPPQPQPEEDAAARDAAEAAAKALASQLGAPLPEDGARAVKPFPLPERLPKHRLRTNPAAAGRAAAIATSRAQAGTAMSVPARGLSQIAREARLSERRAADPQPDDGLTVPDAMPLPPLKLLAVAEKEPASEESRASALDMGAQGSPVVAVLPKEAGIAMFAARIIDGAPMLPEDRSAPAVQPDPEPAVESRPVAPPARRAAPRAADSRAQSKRGDPDSAQDEGARDVAGARKARAYRANVRAHLAGNKPAGAYGSGRAVVAFNLSPDGRPRSVRIARSSGSPTLDQAVLKTVYRAEPFPKPPKGLKPTQLRFLIPFEFR